VTLHQDTWDDKITKNRPEFIGREAEIEQTISNPTAIFESSTTTGNFVFVNAGVKDSGGRSLRVPVKPVGLDGEVRSAYHSSNLSPGVQIWPP
jgi:hypothetical protein